MSHSTPPLTHSTTQDYSSLPELYFKEEDIKQECVDVKEQCCFIKEEFKVKEEFDYSVPAESNLMNVKQGPEVCVSQAPKSCSVKDSTIRVSKQVIPRKTWICPFCPLITNSEDDLSEHTLAAHPRHLSVPLDDRHVKQKPGCCKDQYVEKLPCQAQSSKHSDFGAFICTTCGRSYKTLKYLKRHSLIVHSNLRPFQCDTCNKRFKTKRGLTGHLVLHSNECPFQCETCSKAFKSCKSLRAHDRRVHPEVTIFQCSTCYWRFQSRDSLKRHLAVHSDV